MEPKIAVLIPCYNEAKTIEKVVKDYKNALPEADIYVYDNNSTDGTDKIAKEAGAIVRWSINKIFKSKINDIMTGYRAFSYQFVKSYPVLTKGFETETEMTIYAIDKNFTLKEIPVQYRDRPKGSVSKLNTYKDGVKVIKTIATLFKEYKPGLFFNLISLFIFIVAAILVIPVLIEYMNTGLVPRFPTLIVACILLVICLLLTMTSIILQVIVKKNKQIFEILLNQIRIMNDKND